MRIAAVSVAVASIALAGCSVTDPNRGARVEPRDTREFGPLRLPGLATGRYRLVYSEIYVRGGDRVAYEQRATNMFQIGFMVD